MGLPYILLKILVLIQIFHITHPSSYLCIIFPGYRNFPEYGRMDQNRYGNIIATHLAIKCNTSRNTLFMDILILNVIPSSTGRQNLLKSSFASRQRQNSLSYIASSIYSH